MPTNQQIEDHCDSCGEILDGVIEEMDSDAGIARCDQCRTYPGDLHAAQALADLVGGVVRYYADDESIDWEPGTPCPYPAVAWRGEEDVRIADYTHPWVEVDGEPVLWPAWKEANLWVTYRCRYVVDGVDTDGTTWYRCLEHNELAPGRDAPCSDMAMDELAHRKA